MKEFWQQQAIQHGNDVKAVNFDALEEKLEFAELEKLVKDYESIGDIGCGNGRATLHLARMFPEKQFIGLDFIPEMIEAANMSKASLGLSNVEFYIADLSKKGLDQRFPLALDFIFTKRLLINLKGDEKYNGIENIISILKQGGGYAMIECFIEPLQRVNTIRKHLNLSEIQVRFFNEYLTEEFLAHVKKKLEFMELIDFESLYYFVSRVYNAALTQGTPEYFAPINTLTIDLMENQLAPSMSGYAPEKIYLFRKA